jgi:hypothetical protein
MSVAIDKIIEFLAIHMKESGIKMHTIYNMEY